MSDEYAAAGLISSHGGDLLIALMDALGIDTAFGVVSVHNLPLVDAIDRHRRFVPVRHEAAAVNAADGYGRARNGIGLAITSTGTGAGNAAGSVIESLSAGTSVLHVTGQIETQYLGQGRGFIHETKDQLAMLTAISKSAYSIDSVDTAAKVLRQAAAMALSAPTGPVSIEWPIDLQYARHDVEAFSVELGEPHGAAHDDVAAAADLLKEAKRPVIWVGGGARGAEADLERLITDTRAGVLTSNSGRGIVDEGHASCVGNFANSPAGRQLLASADVLLSVGTHFRSNETSDYQLQLPPRHIQVDVDPEAVGRVYPAEIGLVGDSNVVLGQLIDALPARTATDEHWLDDVARCRDQARHIMRQELGWQATISDAVRAHFPAESPIARDVTIPSSTWGNRLLSISQACTNIFPRGGGIGQGLSMGIGASLATPEVPTMTLVGDGGLAVHFGELMTLAQERPWLVLMVFNDRGYGVLRNTQDAFVARRSGVDLATPEFALIAESLDLPYWRISQLEDVDEALGAAIATKGPSIVEIDVDAMGEMPKPFTPPVTIPQG